MVTASQIPSVGYARPPGRQRRTRKSLATAGAIALLLLGGAVLVVALAVGLMGRSVDGQSSVEVAGSLPASVIVPDRPVDGEIAFTIPLGAADAQFNGGAPYVMPSVIRLQVGDSIVVTNDDAYPHMILNALAPAGETTMITFDKPGAQAFSSGCTANGGTMNSFTSVIVAERA
jgi:hypothetical protein